MAIDKVKLKELVVKKKALDKEQEELVKRQQEWNKDINELSGTKNISWDDLLLKVLSDD